MGNFPVPQPGDKFLWVRFYLLGDVLQGLADTYLLKKKFPQISISFMTREDYVDVVKTQPYIDEVIAGAKSPLSAMNKSIALLREKNCRLFTQKKDSSLFWLKLTRRQYAESLMNC